MRGASYAAFLRLSTYTQLAGQKFQGVSLTSRKLGIRYSGRNVGGTLEVSTPQLTTVPAEPPLACHNHRLQFEETGIAEPPTTYEDLLDAR
jgi:hypothetical protein